MIYASPVIMICSIITPYGFTRWKLAVIGVVEKQRSAERIDTLQLKPGRIIHAVRAVE